MSSTHLCQNLWWRQCMRKTKYINCNLTSPPPFRNLWLRPCMKNTKYINRNLTSETEDISFLQASSNIYILYTG